MTWGTQKRNINRTTDFCLNVFLFFLFFFMWFGRNYFVPYQPISYFVPEDLKLNQPQTGTAIFLVSILLRFVIPAVLMYFLCKKKCHWKSSLSICPCSPRGYIHQVDHGSARVCAEAISLQVFVWKKQWKVASKRIYVIYINAAHLNDSGTYVGWQLCSV